MYHRHTIRAEALLPHDLVEETPHFGDYVVETVEVRGDGRILTVGFLRDETGHVLKRYAETIWQPDHTVEVRRPDVDDLIDELVNGYDPEVIAFGVGKALDALLGPSRPDDARGWTARQLARHLLTADPTRLDVVMTSWVENLGDWHHLDDVIPADDDEHPTWHVEVVGDAFDTREL